VREAELQLKRAIYPNEEESLLMVKVLEKVPLF
jgi:hypothetical protein